MGASESEVNGMYGSQKVGKVDDHAAMWLGTGNSWTDLNPAGASGSQAFSTSGSRQAGYAIIDGAWHAGIWSGTAASWTDLNPAGGSESMARANGDRQVGGANIGAWHAGMWSGSADSWIDLHPSIAGSSMAYATFGTQQGGSAYVDFYEHAALWSGTADSWIDLDPTWVHGVQSTSAVYGMAEGVQVGLVEGVAGMWFGTTDSWFDLGSPLGSPFTWSTAKSVKREGDTYYIAGYALDEHLVPSAVLWTVSPVPEPGVLAIVGLGGIIVWTMRRNVISRPAVANHQTSQQAVRRLCVAMLGLLINITSGFGANFTVDDGSVETFGGTAGGDLLALNRFNTGGQVVLIDEISVLWNPLSARVSPKVALYSDPNGDGNPSDSTPLLIHAIVISPNLVILNNSTLQPYAITPTLVTGSFFVGAYLSDRELSFDPVIGVDTTSPSYANVSWIIEDSSVGGLNLQAPVASSTLTTRLETFISGNHMIRAHYTLVPEPSSLGLFALAIILSSACVRYRLCRHSELSRPQQAPLLPTSSPGR